MKFEVENLRPFIICLKIDCKIQENMCNAHACTYPRMRATKDDQNRKKNFFLGLLFIS